MNSIDDIAKMAIEEVGAELEQMSVKQNAPKPLKSAKLENSNLNVASNVAENPSLKNSTSLENSAKLEILASLENSISLENSTSLKNSASRIKAENSSQSSDLSLNETEKLKNSTADFLKNSQNVVEVKNSALRNPVKSDDERQFLSNLKERIEVLFAGLKANDGDKNLQLELTIRFLEFLLAKTNERLSNL